MASKKRISANRANAKRSTGPKTPTGKHNSSKNALKHGFYSSDRSIWDEDPVEYERLREEIEEVYPPVNAVVRELVHHLADMLWRIRRPSVLEAAHLGSRPQDTLTYIFQMADPDIRMKIAERLGDLRAARTQDEGGEIGLHADFAQALLSEMPEAATALEADIAQESDRWLAAIARHETSLRNGIARTLAMLHALGAGPVGATRA